MLSGDLNERRPTHLHNVQSSFRSEFRPNKDCLLCHRGEYIAIDITLSWFQQQFNFEFGLHPVNVPSLTLVIVV